MVYVPSDDVLEDGVVRALAQRNAKAERNVGPGERWSVVGELSTCMVLVRVRAQIGMADLPYLAF